MSDMVIPQDVQTRIAVCRDGPRGWHWIKFEDFDPVRHTPYPPAVDVPEAILKRPVGRPRKKPTTHTE